MSDAKDLSNLTRRELLAIAGGVAVAGALGCTDAPANRPDAGTEPDAPLADAAPPADTAIASDDGMVDADRPGDVGGSGLTPLRGDGSNPLDYIDTLVIVQMENRSFDHMLGSLRLVEGRMDVDGLRDGMSSLSPGGASTIPIRRLGKDWIIEPDPPHGRNASLQQWNQGANDGFVQAWYEQKLAGLSDAEVAAKLDLVMGYHVRSQVPATYGLADAFTVCDRWHCALLGPTWPNRFFSHCATSNGLTGNDSPINAPTPYPALEQAGFSFATYYTNLYFPLVIQSIPDPHVRGIDAFTTDAAAGLLPNVSIVEPDFFANDDHPPHDVRQGQLFISTIYEALRQSPHWNRCLMLVFYDEHGGFFDHVAPPAAAGNGDGPNFERLGFRVPGMVISPLARRGQTVSTLFEHSSVPALICRLFGLPQLNGRAEMAGDLAEALTLDLVPDANRPDPPALGKLDFQSFELERALVESHCGQPELLAFAKARGLANDATLRLGNQRYRRFLDQAHRLGTLRVR